MNKRNVRLKTEHNSQKPRVSVTFPVDHYISIERIAKEKRVSIAWVVRDAVQCYLESESNVLQAIENKIR